MVQIQFKSLNFPNSLKETSKIFHEYNVIFDDCQPLWKKNEKQLFSIVAVCCCFQLFVVVFHGGIVLESAERLR